MGFIVSCLLILFGIINLTASVQTINSVGGWRSPDLGYVLDIFIAFAVMGVAFISIGLLLIAVLQVLPVPLPLMCMVGPVFSMWLLYVLHTVGEER